MPTARKQQIVHALLAVLTVWPLLHIGLVRQFDTSPWKLAGWGMYTTPRLGQVGMELYGHEPSLDTWERLDAPSAAVRDAATAFLEHHRWLRRLARPTALLAAIRADHPRWDRLRMVVSYPVLDRTTSRITMTTDERELSLR